MLVELGVGIGLLVVGLFVGSRFGATTGNKGVAEIENKAKVTRDKAREVITKETTAKLALVDAAARESKNRATSDVLVDMIEKGELKR